MSYPLKEKAKRLLEQETNLLSPSFGKKPYSVILAYPNTYKIGMSNLGFQSVYALINQEKELECQRVFLPEKEDGEEYKRTNTPLFSLETQTPLEYFDILAFSLSFELDYLNMLKMMELGKIPFKSQDRGSQHPLVLAGGPCVFFNPEPIAQFVDLFLIGEGEEMLSNVCQQYIEGQKKDLDKEEILLALAQLPGVYVPKFYQPVYENDGKIGSIKRLAQVPEKIQRQWVKNLDEYQTASVILSPHTQFGDMFLLELSRGCGRQCRFCMAGYSYRPPRCRSLETVWETAKTGLNYRKKLGLVGAAISDYPWIDQLCQRIREEDGEISVSSLRVDSLSMTLLASLVDSGNRTVTIAPEAGSERLRRVINKGVLEEDIKEALKSFNKFGISQVKLYFMLGLPTETEEDLEEMINLAKNIRDGLTIKGKKKVTLGVSPFVPKPFTPFQWDAMESLADLETKLAYLKKSVQREKNLELSFESPRLALIQALLSRGDRRIGEVLLEAYRQGGAYQSWLKALKKYDLELSFYLYRTREMEEVFPWDYLQSGVEKEYLWRERIKASQEEKTNLCLGKGCRICGVCQKEE